MRSPIERRLLDALRDGVPSDFCVHDATDARGLHYDKMDKHLEPRVYGSYEAPVWTTVFSGMMVASYKPDFLFMIGESTLVVECDGHEFHDRTKQQAAADRARDRELLRLDIVTMRFTGSEIVHGAPECAREIYNMLRFIQERDKKASDDLIREHSDAEGWYIRARDLQRDNDVMMCLGSPGFSRWDGLLAGLVG